MVTMLKFYFLVVRFCCSVVENLNVSLFYFTVKIRDGTYLTL